MSMISGTVKELFVKYQKGQPVVKPAECRLTLRTGWGLEEDVNANPNSPRQVLLTQLETISSLGLSPGDLKENIVVSGLDIDTLPSGSVLQIGDAAQIRITFQCEVCHHLKALPISSLTMLQGKRGVLGVVVKTGLIQINDPVRILSLHYGEIPYKVYQRFLWVVQRIPFGAVVTYTQLIDLLGIPKAHVRVFPTYIKRTSGVTYPVHRIVDSKGCLIRHVSNQAQLLTNEQVTVSDGCIDLEKYSWNTTKLYS